MSTTAKRITALAVIAVLALAITGFITGAIGSALLGRGEGYLPIPEVHLAPQIIAGPHQGEAVHGGMDWLLTNTLLSSLITSGILILLFVGGTARMRMVPKGFQNLLEALVAGILDFMEGVVGREKARQLFPIIATIFLFVLVNAWLGLIPIYQTFGYTKYDSVTLGELDEGFNAGEMVTADMLEDRHLVEHGRAIEIVSDGGLAKPLTVEAHRFSGDSRAQIEGLDGRAEKLPAPGLTATLLRPAGTDVNMPLALALVSFVLVEFLGIRALGLSYFGKFLRFGTLMRGRIGPGLIEVFVGILELLSEFIRMVSFTFRLFGNMTAGEILLLVSAFLVSFVATDIFYALELLVGFIQALIFAGLTLVFAGVAMTPHEEEH